MGFKCCVENCGKGIDDGHNLHRFPIKDAKTCSLWLDRIGCMKLKKIERKKLYANCRVCDTHFHELCKCPRTNRLRRGSLPVFNVPGYSGPFQIDNVFCIEEMECKDRRMFNIGTVVSDENIGASISDVEIERGLSQPDNIICIEKDKEKTED